MFLKPCSDNSDFKPTPRVQQIGVHAYVRTPKVKKSQKMYSRMGPSSTHTYGQVNHYLYVEAFLINPRTLYVNKSVRLKN